MRLKRRGDRDWEGEERSCLGWGGGGHGGWKFVWKLYRMVNWED